MLNVLPVELGAVSAKMEAGSWMPRAVAAGITNAAHAATTKVRKFRIVPLL